MRAWILALGLASLAAIAPDSSCQTYDLPGPYEVARSYMVVSNSYPGSSSLRLRVHAPVLPPGTPTEPGPPYPLLVFAHGLGASPLVYALVLDHFASWGFVIVAPDTFPTGPQADLATDVLATYAVLQDMLAQGQAPFAGLVAPGQAGVFGHSMGGGAAVQAAAAEPELVALLPVSPWAAPSQPPGWLPPDEAMALTDSPLLIIVGATDIIAPVGIYSQPIYDNATSQAHLRELCVVAHAGHITDMALWTTTCEMGVAFFKAYLQAEASPLDVVYGPAAQTSPDTTLQFEVTEPDCFLSGLGSPGSTLGIHASGPAGSDVLCLVSQGLLSDPPPVPGFGLDLADLTLLLGGRLDSSQVKSLWVALPPDGQTYVDTTFHLQVATRPIGGEWSVSPVRDFVAAP